MDANGLGSSKGAYVSVYVNQLPGDYDDQLDHGLSLGILILSCLTGEATKNSTELLYQLMLDMRLPKLQKEYSAKHVSRVSCLHRSLGTKLRMPQPVAYTLIHNVSR